MNCSDMKQYIAGLVDNELAGAEKQAAEAHCRECKSCNGILQAHLALKGGLGKINMPAAPPDLRGNLEYALSVRPEPKRFWLYPAMAAAAALLLFVLALILTGHFSAIDIPSAVAESVDTYDQFMSGKIKVGCKCDNLEMSGKMSRQAGEDCSVPELGKDCNIIGGTCCCDIRQPKHPFVIYRKGGAYVALVFAGQSCGGEACEKNAVFNVKGRTVIKCSGHLWVSSMKERELSEFITKYKPGAMEENMNMENKQEIRLSVPSIGCAACCASITKALMAVPGVENVQCSVEKKGATVVCRKEILPETLINALQKIKFNSQLQR